MRLHYKFYISKYPAYRNRSSSKKIANECQNYTSSVSTMLLQITLSLHLAKIMSRVISYEDICYFYQIDTNIIHSIVYVERLNIQPYSRISIVKNSAV